MDKHCVNCVMLPRNNFRIWWDILQMGLLFYIAFMIPYRVGFNNFGCEQLSLSCMSASSILDLLVEVLFVLDVILTFFSSYHSRKTGFAVTKKCDIAMHSLAGWFWIDFVSVVPWSHIMKLFVPDDIELHRKLRYLAIFRLARLVRATRIKDVISTYAQDVMWLAHILQLYTVLQLTVLLLFLCHILCCVWYYVGGYELTVDTTNATLFLESEGQLDSWRSLFTKKGIPVNDYGSRYMYSFYWAFTTLSTTGYGDISASNNLEMGWSIFCMVMSMFVLSSTINTLQQFTASDDSRHNFKAQVDALCSMKDVPRGLKIRVQEYYDNKFKETIPGLDITEVIEDLPVDLGEGLREHVYHQHWGLRKKTFWKFLYMEKLEQHEHNALFSSLTPRLFKPNELIYSQGSENHSIYILHCGHVRLARCRDPSLDKELEVAKADAGRYQSPQRTRTDTTSGASKEGKDDPSEVKQFTFETLFAPGNIFGEVEAVYSLNCPPGKQRKNFRRQGSASAVGIAEILQITEEALAKLHRGHPRVIQCFALSATLRRAKTVEKFRDSFAKFDTAPRGRERRSTRDAVTVEDAKQIEHKVLHKSTLRFAYLMFDALHPLSYEKEGEIDMGDFETFATKYDLDTVYQYDIIPEIECEYRKGRYINKKDFGTWWCGLAKRAEEAALAYGGVADNDPEVETGTPTRSQRESEGEGDGMGDSTMAQRMSKLEEQVSRLTQQQGEQTKLLRLIAENVGARPGGKTQEKPPTEKPRPSTPPGRRNTSPRRSVSRRRESPPVQTLHVSL